MASTCIPCQAHGVTHTFEDPDDYSKHMKEKHSGKAAAPVSLPSSIRSRRSGVRESPRQPRGPKRKK